MNALPASIAASAPPTVTGGATAGSVTVAFKIFAYGGQIKRAEMEIAWADEGLSLIDELERRGAALYADDRVGPVQGDTSDGDTSRDTANGAADRDDAALARRLGQQQQRHGG